MSRQPMDRRMFLRGVGTAVALPLLDQMMPTALAALPKGAEAVAKVRPNRMLFMFVPNGIHMADWTPTTEGAFELPWILQPLAKVKNDFSVVSGLAQLNARALGDGGGDHARSNACFLTGARPRKTNGADIKNGISVDQYAAQKL